MEDIVDGYERARERMVERHLIPRGIQHENVLAAMRTVPRHVFVERAYQDNAYEDHPLPIGEGQTISQPYMVALMTQLLDIDQESRVLEIGTGSGYQTAVLAEIAQKVYTVERVVSLADRARKIFEQLEYKNVDILTGDGTLGWQEHAPYDGILVTAGAPIVPKALVEQLTEGGKMVIPVGSRVSQALQVLTKQPGGEIDTTTSCHCVFVKLIGEEGWEG